MNCETLYCVNDAREGRRHCNKCASRKRRENKMRAAYDNLRTNARRRFIEFSITWRYWEVFCRITQYHELRGRGAQDLCIDRKIVTLGYTDYNIQAITNEENNRKQHTIDRAVKVKALAEKYKQEGAPF